MEDFVSVLLGVFFGLIIGLVILAVVSLIFQWLWNTTMPDVFGVKSITLGQAFKIMLISAMLFGGGTTVVERAHEVVPDQEPVTQTG